MYFKEFLKQFEQKRIKLYVDMDGVIADYDFGSPCDYDKKRPLWDSIKKLEEISHYPNIELYILSVTRKTEGIQQKQKWLNQNAPFFTEDHRIILSREANEMEKSEILKKNYLASLTIDECIIMVIDDDPRVLKEIHKSNEEIVLLKDTVLID